MSRILIAAAVALFSTAPAYSETSETFTRDGVTYIYTVSDLGPARIIQGRVFQGDKFKLIVRNGRVTGHVAGRPVAFRAKDAWLAREVEVAAR